MDKAMVDNLFRPDVRTGRPGTEGETSRDWGCCYAKSLSKSTAEIFGQKAAKAMAVSSILHYLWHNQQIKQMIDIINIGILFQVVPFALFLMLAIAVTCCYKNRKWVKMLRESEVKYRLLFDNNLQPMFIFDLVSLKFLETNNAAVGHYGYSTDEFMGMTIKDICLPEDISEFLADIEKIGCCQVNNCKGEWKHKKKNGEIINVELTAQSLTSKGKDTCYILVHDITGHKQAEEELPLYGEIIENMAEGIFLIRKSDGIIVYTNRAVAQMFAAYKSELLGKHISTINAPTEKKPDEIADDIFKDLNTTGNWEGELKNLRVDGTVFWCYAHVTSFSHPKYGNVWILIHQDITEKKKMLGDLIEAKEKAEENDQLKTAFLNNISHEIRTPFNSILGFLQLIQEEGISANERAEYFDIINKSADRLMKTIYDIVEISQIQSGQVYLAITETNVGELTDKVYEYFKHEADIKGLDFNFNMQNGFGPINSDGVKLKSILSILISNAIKFTKSGTIEFGYKLTDIGTVGGLVPNGQSLRPEDKESRITGTTTIEFYVKDTGVGIPKDKCQIIFDRFIQADGSNTRRFEGSGLGLSIAKAYVEMLEGEIWVESEQGKGSIFYFTIPYNAGSGQNMSLSNELTFEVDEIDIKKLKILIADDDESSGRLISIIVKKIATEIIYVETGAETVEACRKRPDIDLVLMDVKMPDMDGYEATKQIRQFNTDMVIIAQTAYALAGEREKAIAAGCDDYISKPIEKKELVRLVSKYIKI